MRPILLASLLASFLFAIGCCKCGDRCCPCKEPEKKCEPADKAR